MYLVDPELSSELGENVTDARLEGGDGASTGWRCRNNKVELHATRPCCYHRKAPEWAFR